MKVLLIKQSSLGDIIHVFPALSQAMDAIPGLSIDWLVEENFAQIPFWHPAVNNVIPIALRRWKKQLFSAQTQKEIRAFKKQTQQASYDCVIDAQGLIKSALFAKWAHAPAVGFSWDSIRTEKIASCFYNKRIEVAQGTHAIRRLQQLFAQALGYEADLHQQPEYRLHIESTDHVIDQPFVMGLHGTTWESKKLPLEHWIKIAQNLATKGLSLYLPEANSAEAQWVQRLSERVDNVVALPRMTLTEVVQIMQQAQGVIAVDTGLVHIAAALGVPNVSVFGATNPVLTAPLGPQSTVLSVDYHCAPCLRQQCRYSDSSPPCYQTVSAEVICQNLMEKIDSSRL